VVSADDGAPPEIVVDPSAAQLAEHAAQRLITTLAAALAVRPVGHLVLTGGGILEQLLRTVRTAPDRDTVEWRRVHVWWADERYVASDSDERNDKPAFAALLDHLPLDPDLVHRMPAADSAYGEDVEAAAAGYARELAAAVTPDHAGEDVPHFDVVLLGVGPDGHCASLFPGHPAVYERDAAVIAVRHSPKPPPIRLSMTFGALDAANEVWFVAAGDSKADAVAKAHAGTDPTHVPASRPRGRQRTLWLVDRAAAAQLPDNLYKPPGH
jgi:6-phosphogluconolactonase